ncbi:MAG TPA: AbrB/MazE/SpoVT family DNA-binding domain-containing protein [Verrucomicrobiae bacterium]|jgi:AbrB family looped-hinge helix DNA binding protein
MTIVHMSAKGQIVVPKDIRDRHGFRNGSAFAVRQTKSGAIVLKPVQSPGKSGFIDAIRGIMSGVEIPEMRFRTREPSRGAAFDNSPQF